MAEWWASAAVAALSFVLASAGAAKLSRGSTPVGLTRPAQGAFELGLAAAVLLAPVRVGGAVLAVLFTGFAAVHARHHRDRATEDCECFGETDGSERGAHRLALTAVSALLAAAAAAFGRGDPLSLLVNRPASGLTALGVAVLAAGLWRASFVGSVRGPGAGDRLVNGSALLLEQRFSRRGLLVRLAAAGSALTVAPLRYLLYPGTALAAISPGECAGGACTDGYTAFCCEINQGRNSCPTGTFPGGWWMCTDYPGRRLCAEAGVRYYVDCNALPDREFPGGCRCANGSCENQRVACNVFRYGQCNTQIAGVTAVVCRMVVCENPSTISELNCSASLAVDDSVCEQDTPCLEPAIELVGGGGV